jgi:hypothetical protein
MKGYNTNIEKDTLSNNNFRKMLYTSKHIQLVLMSLRPGEEIGKKFILKMINSFVLKAVMENA